MIFHTVDLQNINLGRNWPWAAACGMAGNWLVGGEQLHWAPLALYVEIILFVLL